MLDINVSAIGDRAVPIALATAGLAGARSSRFGAAVALPIRTDDEGGGVLVPTGWPLAEPVAAEIAEFLVDVDHRGTAGTARATSCSSASEMATRAGGGVPEPPLPRQRPNG